MHPEEIMSDVIIITPWTVETAGGRGKRVPGRRGGQKGNVIMRLMRYTYIYLYIFYLVFFLPSRCYYVCNCFVYSE